MIRKADIQVKSWSWREWLARGEGPGETPQGDTTVVAEYGPLRAVCYVSGNLQGQDAVDGKEYAEEQVRVMVKKLIYGEVLEQLGELRSEMSLKVNPNGTAPGVLLAMAKKVDGMVQRLRE